MAIGCLVGLDFCRENSFFQRSPYINTLRRIFYKELQRTCPTHSRFPFLWKPHVRRRPLGAGSEDHEMDSWTLNPALVEEAEDVEWNYDADEDSFFEEEDGVDQLPLLEERELIAPLPTAAMISTPSQVHIGGVGLMLGFVLAFIIQGILSRFRSTSRSNNLIIRSPPPLSPTSPVLLPLSEDGESVEWVNMCWRKMWRVYQRGLERWLAGVLQPVFNKVVRERAAPTIVQGLKIEELTFDHQAPYFSNMRRRTSRKDSDLNGVVDVRYTGGARMLLMLEIGGGRWRVKVPVLVSDLDLECQLWLKIRLAPLTPYLGTISFAFVGPPNIKVQLAPYNSVRLMRVPLLQNFLTQLLTIDLPAYMVLPKILNINIPPAVTAVAEAAVGRDAVMKAVASAVLQADALEQSLRSALPLGPQSAAGGITLPESFQGELSVALIEGRNLPVWGFPWQSNPYCRLTLGKQAVISKRENETSFKGSHRHPLWNQEFEFLVENLETQVLDVYIKDSHITGRPEVGKVEFSLAELPKDGSLSIWLPVQASNPGQTAAGELHLDISYKPFFDEESDFRNLEAEKYAKEMEELTGGKITDIKSAAAASSKAAAAASAAFSAVAMTRAAAARAAHKAQNAALAAAQIASLGRVRKKDEDSDEDDDDDDLIDRNDLDPDTYNFVDDQTKEENTEVLQISVKAAPVEMVSPVSVLPNLQLPVVKEQLNGTPTSLGTNLHDADLDLLLRPVKGEKNTNDDRTQRDGSLQSHPVSLDTIQAAADTLEFSQKPALLSKAEDKDEASKQRKKMQWWTWMTTMLATWRSRQKTVKNKVSLETEGSSHSSESSDKKDGESVNSVVYSADVPLEEIAKEVVRLKSATERDSEEQRNQLLEEAMKRSDRKWIMLFCFLTTISIAMLTIVAMRIGPI